MSKREVLGETPERMVMEHAALDRRARDLDRKVWRTPSEQMELSELKKRKLVLKDMIRASHPPPAPSERSL